MILTNCAACAAPLSHTAPRCVRCDTRYCKLACQQQNYAETLFIPENASRDDQREAVAILVDATETRRRIFGANHPYTVNAIQKKEAAQMRLEDVDAPPS